MGWPKSASQLSVIEHVEINGFLGSSQFLFIYVSLFKARRRERYMKLDIRARRNIMKRLNSIIGTTVTAVVAFVGVSQTFGQKVGAHPSPIPPPLNVKVINTPSEPVPVAGTVNVENLSSRPLSVRDVDNPARRAVQATASCGLESSELSCTATIFSVPANKRLVIEYFSERILVPEGQVARVGILTKLASDELVLHAVYTPASEFSLGLGSIWTGQQVKIYADAETEVLVRGSRSSSSGQAAFFFTISGHLVDIP